MALRVNLLFETPESQTNVLVSLTQAAPDGGDSLLVAAVRRLSQRLDLPLAGAAHCWVQAYCDRVLLPLFSAEADYGWFCWRTSKISSLRCSRISPSG